MNKWIAARYAASALYTLEVAFVVGKWAVGYAYRERGYDAAGGEYCLVLLACWLAWGIINYFFDALEEMVYGRN